MDRSTSCDALNLAGSLFGNDPVATHIANQRRNTFDYDHLAITARTKHDVFIQILTLMTKRTFVHSSPLSPRVTGVVQNGAFGSYTVIIKTGDNDDVITIWRSRPASVCP